ncbi:MAG TPA: hypothetical protein VF011_05230 [Terriglobales bacterium]
MHSCPIRRPLLLLVAALGGSLGSASLTARDPALVLRNSSLDFQAGAPATAHRSARALPLNRFQASRAEATPHAYSHLAVGIADDYFDGTSPQARVRRHLRVAHQLGVKYFRCAFSWNAIEKVPGQYRWAFWDMLVREAASAHVELIPYVAYTPQWAAASETNFWRQPPRNPNLYAEFMERIVERYRGKIHAWEIWNEPDNRDYWQGSAQGYAELVRAAALAMRRADPSVVLVLGGMSHGPGPFFRELLPHIAGYVDVIAMHAYPESWDEQRAEEVYEHWPAQMTALVDEQAPGTDFWINEMGYADYRFSANRASPYGISVFYNYEHTSAYQAEFLFKTEVMALAFPRTSLTAWYRIDDFSSLTTHFSADEVNYHLGLLDAARHPKPAFYAMKFFEKLFGGQVTHIPVRLQVANTAGKVNTLSDAVVNVFRADRSELIITGWLRSSLPSEVHDHSGTSQDSRNESVSIALPCQTVSRARSYDVEGHALASPARFADGWLRGTPLSGDRVFIEVLQCKN